MLPVLPSISDAQTLMRRGKLRPIDLVEHCLGRIHQFEDQIHAWVMVDEEGARQEAHRLGKMLDDGQEPVGPLHGIPIGIKDIIDVAGWPTLCGSKLREGHVAEKDAFVVKNLREAGAIILGKTVTTEWASFDPPATRNPWNLNHTPGGSSSGSAAAVAMEMCMAALGTQTGGSIIRPASYCGVVGLKPHFNLPDMRGIFPFSRHLDHVGPMARSVGDVEAIWTNMLEPTLLERVRRPGEEFTKLFFLEGGFIDEAGNATRSHYERAREALSEWFAVHSMSLPDYFCDVHAYHRCIMAVEGAEIHREAYERSPDEFPFHIGSLIAEGRSTRAIDYALALRRQQEIRIRFLDEMMHLSYDGVFVLPSTPTPAPSVASTGDPLFNSPWSFLGFQSITIPLGLSSDRLPLGLQLICPSFRESIIGTAKRCETLLKFNSHSPLLYPQH